jgi:hypothetical protein
MTLPTPTSIVSILSTGTYNISPEFFDFKQIPERRHYPSIEVFDVDPGSQDRTKQRDYTHFTFKVRIFQKLGSSINQEDADQRQAEQTVITLLEAAVLAEHRIIVENESMTSDRIQERHPYYYMSELTVVVRSVKTPSLPLDGILVFDKTNSSVDNAPTGNYTYVACYDTLISDGYRDIHEYVSSNPQGKNIPVPFAGGYNGRFITNIVVNVGDIGTTGEKVNHMADLKANGEKPEFVFIYTNKTDNSPTPLTITESGFKVRFDSVDRTYNSGDNVVFRAIGRAIKPGTITAT